ncbi:MAG: hypothetical protein AABX03_00635 [Nanoarchaeota archaeon]
MTITKEEFEREISEDFSNLASLADMHNSLSPPGKEVKGISDWERYLDVFKLMNKVIGKIETYENHYKSIGTEIEFIKGRVEYFYSIVSKDLLGILVKSKVKVI